MLLLTSLLVANTYTVIQNGNGDFTTIQSAVNGVLAGDEIIVFDGTYYEDITINIGNLTLRSFGGSDNCIIDGNSHCITVNVATERIEGFTFTDASNTALVIIHSVSELSNCIFEDNEKTGIGGSAITHDVTSDDPFDEISDCIFRDNEGGYTVFIRCDYMFYHPIVNETLKKNIFLDNTNTSGKDIYLSNPSLYYTCSIESNTFKGSSGGLYFSGISGGVDILNCAFDEAGIDYDNMNQNNVTINYCCFSDPELNSTTCQPLWNSTVKSPCIDTGYGLDSDGTPADIGAVSAITHKYDIVELPSPSENNGWKWLSFPALDNVLGDADVAENVLENILDPNILDKVVAEDYTIDYNSSTQTWYHSSEQFSRTEGFKFHMNDDYDLDVPGFKVNDNTEIVLNGNNVENWVGYWLEDTQEIEDAFADYWDGSNIYYIQSQFWTAHYENGAWQTTSRVPTLSYGDMVIVKCRSTISDFEWNNGAPTEKTVFADPEYFSYSEQADYVPLYIEVGENDIPQEIGAIVNGECIGATVVEDIVNQINVYTTSTSPGNIELELYYGNRSENKIISSYKCVSSSNPNTIMSQLSTEHVADSWYIDLREGSSITPTPENLSLDNYPNPFNPSTTISYSLPHDGMVEISVYNIKGQLVKTLVKGEQLAGNYEAVWNGKDKNEKSVSSGIYFYKLSTKDETIMKKMLMLK